MTRAGLPLPPPRVAADSTRSELFAGFLGLPLLPAGIFLFDVVAPPWLPHLSRRAIISASIVLKGTGMPYSVAIVVGSLRKDSFNRKIANTFIKVAPATLKPEIAEIGELTLFNQDIEAHPPASWVAFKGKIKAADAVLFVTPEYNRSMPGVLKNAIDVASRPYGKGAINGKPAAIMSVSTGAVGGFGANHHLRQSAVFLDMPMLQQPEMYIGAAAGLWDDEGAFKSEDTRKLFEKFAAA